ncbi:sodium:phosphate symporter [Campylobacter blaseri]|uniref:Sodium:phosphate symporter n=1 Tax=Campylobacter blaseri TaxID=2042961 RepID=A0A2P8R270_9BACT|nr:Na/Pi symporter [Campylobacter blaseri]PSM52587.1 sodium:phosphate symporter [Campylobacter blaseri]PSM54235.1 sodium:phosphate symporter [Campylobacter blaseri]QKF85886.1 sodium:phosphate symporter [Campylobacter blaseri]
MLKRIFLPSIVIVLAYALWVNENFKVITFGVAIFLFGMVTLERGFKLFSGGALENILEKSTNKLYKSLSFGIITTTLMQSSSLISVLTISFLGAGLISLYQGIGIILGANIGTTTGAWLMALYGFKVDLMAYSMPVLIFGILFIFLRGKSLNGFGYILIGLGFLLFGIAYMKDGFEVFKDAIDLTKFAIPGLKGAIVFASIGVLATVIMQSSHATLIITLAALATNQITYDNSLALTIGANIGTTVTAIIGSFTSGIEGRRLAGAHFIFNVLTGIIAILILEELKFLTDKISYILSISDSDLMLKLAVFNTVFKVLGVIIFIPFLNKLILFLNTIFKEKNFSVKNIENIKFLNDEALEIPLAAITVLKKETEHLYHIAFKIISKGLSLNEDNVLSNMRSYDVIVAGPKNDGVVIDEAYMLGVQHIYDSILEFSTKAQLNANSDDIQKIYAIKLANRHIISAIKATRNLEKHMKLYTCSQNEYIKKYYNSMRKRLIKILRAINILLTADNRERQIRYFKKITKYISKAETLTNKRLNIEIRENRITNIMATDLISDNIYVQDIANNLFSVVKILFINDRSDIEKEKMDSKSEILKEDVLVVKDVKNSI